MADITFRDFAAALMQGKIDEGTGMLETLLGLPPTAARAATEHFRARLGDPAFLPKAMALRTAVTSGSDAEIADVLGECFGLAGDARSDAVAAVRRRYPAAPAS